MGQRPEALRQRPPVAVAHPHLAVVEHPARRKAGWQGRRWSGRPRRIRGAALPATRPPRLWEQLHAVADAQHRAAAVEHVVGQNRRGGS